MTNQDAKGQEILRGNNGQSDNLLSTSISNNCVEITERYCSRVITKVVVIFKLQSILPYNNETTYHEALRAYIQVLNNFKCICERIISGEYLTGGQGNQGREASSDNKDREEDTDRQNK
jgi:hypothetical protein